MAETIRVAPREIVDMTFRAARVLGCDAGVADRVAADVEHSEVQHGCGLSEFWRLVDRDSDAMARAAAEAIVPSESTPQLFSRRAVHRPTGESVAAVRTALATGVDVDETLWNRLVGLAADFLLSEAMLDAASTMSRPTSDLHTPS